jgi:transcription-repair coupling factor (superfamily II helicase)
LRGGGAVFGYKQSGAVGRVGFDLYNKFLDEAVQKMVGQKILRCRCLAGSVDSAFVPEEYISASRMRVWLYKEVSSIDSEGALDVFIDRVSSIFGPPPLFLNNLFILRRVELLGGLCFFSKIFLKKSAIKVSLDVFFWENKIDSLFNVLFGYKFTLFEGGAVFEVSLEKEGVLSFLKEVYIRIKKNVK